MAWARRWRVRSRVVMMPLGTRGRGFFLGQDEVDKMRGFKGEGRGAGAVAPEADGVRLPGLEFLGAERAQPRHAGENPALARQEAVAVGAIGV